MGEHDIDTLLAFLHGVRAGPRSRYYSDYWPSFETAAAPGRPPTGARALLIGPESRTFAAARSKNRADRPS